MIELKKAKREQNLARVALCGPAGSGKTMSALLLARGLAGDGDIAVIDTERGSASLYSDTTDFFTIVIDPPFTPERYHEALDICSKSKNIKCVIIDSLSHAWEGDGGILDQQQKAIDKQKTKNSYTAWRDVTPMHNQLVDKIMRMPQHVIACMRSKMEYVVEQDDNKKTSVRKVGLKPIQRDGVDYEFDLVFDVDQEKHTSTASKNRTPLFVETKKISIDDGKSLAVWLGSAEPIAQKLSAPASKTEQYKPELITTPNAVDMLADDKPSKPMLVLNLGDVYKKSIERGISTEEWKTMCANIGLSRANGENQVKLRALIELIENREINV